MGLGILLFCLEIVIEIIDNCYLLGLYISVVLVCICGFILFWGRYYWCIVIIIVVINFLGGGLGEI